MNILITGGGGFLGLRLAEALTVRGVLLDAQGREQSIQRITLLDSTRFTPPADPRVEAVTGDICDRALLERLIGPSTASVFHLAAIVSGMAEAEFDLGMRINVEGTRLLLEVCRAAGTRPRLVFTSSVAVFGGELPATVQDSTAVNPQTSYGMEKAIGELLVGDYSRRGFIDGRALRLPTISVRPGRPNAAASSFASGVIREPLNGEEAICPVGPDARMWLLSPSRVIESLIRAHDLPPESFGVTRVLNLPGISVTAGEMVAALERVAGPEVASRVRWQPDERISRMVAGWPGAFNPQRALSMGFRGDASFDDIVRAYVEESGASVS
jgi:nucleoside-diphosphate-sugar epimerase